PLPSILPFFFFFPHPSPPALYTLSLHDALPISPSAFCLLPSVSCRAGCPSRSSAACATSLSPRPERFTTTTLPFSSPGPIRISRSEEHTSELQSLAYLVCRLLLEKKKKK